MLLALLHAAPTEAPSDAPPWWFLASIVLAVLAAALFTMRLALAGKKRGGAACPNCSSQIKTIWIRCPACGIELGARSNGASHAHDGGGGARPAVAAHVGPAVIEFKSGPLSGRVFPLERDVTTFGSVEGNTVLLQDTGVSRKHVGIRKVDGGSYELADLGSTNGVFVNGEKTARRKLVAGDVIRIGTSEALFRS